MGLLGPDGRPVGNDNGTSIAEGEGWALNSAIPDIHDSEIIEIERRVLEPLSTRSGSYTDLESFRKEAIDRFRDVGFVVEVQVFTTNVENVYWFDFNLTRRLRPFDPDQQVWEVTNDILETGEGGVIKTDSGMLKDLMDGAPSQDG